MPIKRIAIISALGLIRSAKLALFVCSLALCAFHLTGSRTPTALERVLDAGEIHMISRNGPTTYYEGPEGLMGFEYTIAKGFAKYLGVKLVIHDEEDLGVIIDKVDRQRVHFAAAGLAATKKRRDKVLFAPSYMEVSQQLIYQSGQTRPKDISEIIGKRLVVVANSSHAETLRGLQREHPELTWEERHDVEMLDLLEMVHAGEADYTIVDSNAYKLSESLYPRARVALDLRESEALAWAFPKSEDSSLFDRAVAYFNAPKTIAAIQDATNTYYGHIGELDYSGALLFAHRLDARLPKWEQKLKQAAADNELDWQLLAALSYQESHWNPRAKSPTGVRGFMMLTLATAKQVGVKNRLNPDQSITGGAKYFRSLYDRLPDRLDPADRTWLALAAYNVGFGHLEDARILTEFHGGDPDKWSDIKETLPLLAKRKYYKFTKHGYARGWEAVDYVQNIRNFHTIIAWNEKEKQQIAQTEALEDEFKSFSPVVSEAVKNITLSTL